MKSSGKQWLGLVAALCISASGWADRRVPDIDTPLAPVASWETVGRGVNLGGQAEVPPSRGRAVADKRMEKRKADMVRRMFWIMLAHR